MKSLLITYYHSSSHHHGDMSPESAKAILGCFIILNVIFAVLCILALIKWLKKDSNLYSYWDILTDDESSFFRFFFPAMMILIDGIVLLGAAGWLLSQLF